MSKRQDLKRFSYINCVCCGFKIELLDLASHSNIDEFIKYYTHNGIYEPENQMWNNGVVKRLSAGYGSRFDFDEFYIGICDDCIDTHVKNGRLRYAGDYMNDLMQHYSDDELEEFEKKRNRENNLNDLLD
jgi:hypothetical protein